MAKFIPSSTIQAISGSVGSNTYSRVKSGLVIKSKSHPGSKNPYTPSTAQQGMNGMFGSLAGWWQLMSVGERAAWNDIAKTRYVYNSYGQQYHQSGFNFFCSVNQNLALQGINWTANLPPQIVPVQLLKFTTNYYPTSPSHLYVTFTGEWTDPNTTHLIFASKPQSVGITSCTSAYRLVSLIPPSTTNHWDYLNAYITVFGAVTPNQKIFVKLIPLSTISGLAGRSVYNSFITS